MLTLHEAIVEVLLSADEAMTARVIAAKVNRLGLYIRRDGMPVPPTQISARVNKYPHLFTRKSGLIGLQRGSPASLEFARQPNQLPDTHAPPGLICEGGDSSELAPIAELPFRDVGVVRDLLATGLPHYDWLDRCGVYALILPPECEVTFLTPNHTREARNVISPWEVERLKRKWVDGTRIVYIGLAGGRSARSLRQRLRDLLNHCGGKTSINGPHRGGEILWQLVRYESLLLRAMPTDGPPVPRDTERALLEAFMKLHGALPFANRKG